MGDWDNTDFWGKTKFFSITTGAICLIAVPSLLSNILHTIGMSTIESCRFYLSLSYLSNQW